MAVVRILLFSLYIGAGGHGMSSASRGWNSNSTALPTFENSWRMWLKPAQHKRIDALTASSRNNATSRNNLEAVRRGAVLNKVSTGILDNKVSMGILDAFRNAPLGSLGPVGTKRTHFVYYDKLLFLVMQYGMNARSLLEVGCADQPLSAKFTWIPTKHCVAPYFATYRETKKENVNDGVIHFKADFLRWKAPLNYDLLVCSQVVEHVPDPGAFVQGLIQAAKTAIISVPHLWKDEACENCHHISHEITAAKFREWASPYWPVEEIIVREERGGAERIVFVFTGHKTSESYVNFGWKNANASATERAYDDELRASSTRRAQDLQALEDMELS